MEFETGRALQKKARLLAEKLIETQRNIQLDRTALAFGRILELIRAKLMENLSSAIETTKEFDIEPLRSTLIGVFQDEEMFKVDQDGLVYSLAEDIAGSESDFFDGITYARSVLGLGKFDKQTAAKFWRIFIYQPYREGGGDHGYKTGKMTNQEYAKWAYQRTIDARLQGWHGKAPYWIILESGNNSSS